MFDRKNIALEVLSNCEFLSNQMFDRKNIALCLTEPLCQTEISTDVLSNQRFDRTSQKCQKYKYFTQNTQVWMSSNKKISLFLLMQLLGYTRTSCLAKHTSGSYLQLKYLAMVPLDMRSSCDSIVSLHFIQSRVHQLR